MDLLAKMEEKKVQFEQLKVNMDRLNKEAEGIEASKKQVSEEMLRMQGEYRILVEIGVEEGITDQSGAPIQPAPVPEDVEEVDPSTYPQLVKE